MIDTRTTPVVLVSLLLLFSCCNNPSPNQATSERLNKIPQVLLATRYENLEDFQQDVTLNYHSNENLKSVTLYYKNGNKSVTSFLEMGINQQDIMDAKEESWLRQAFFTLKHPSIIRKRKQLSEIYLLARKRPNIFGEGDIAFYNIAEATVSRIITPELAYKVPKDSSEKGYINTINHTTAQAFITSLFSKSLADLIADLHELKYMPELCTGEFSQEQLRDTLNYPVDNYVDIINNEIGQALGLWLNEKLNITQNTYWTPEITANYLSNLNSFYSWSFGIGLKPFLPSDQTVIRFAHKINRIKENQYDY